MLQVTLKQLREAAGFSQAALAKKIGVGQSTIGMWESGKNKPEFSNLEKLAHIFNVPIDCIIGRKVDYSPQPHNTSGVWVPVLGRVAAGIPIEAIEDIDDYEEISAETARTGDFFGLKIQGDSMEPRISNGDVVIVRKQSDCDTGDVVVVLINGDAATVKRIKKMRDGIMLIANNPAYEPTFYSNKEIENLPVIVLGKVVELRGKF